MIAANVRLEEIVARMKESGCRLTPQRMAVLKILIEREDHPSVEQIYEQVRLDFPMTSLATVYKTVSLLKEMGEVVEIGLSDGGNRYDGATPAPHPHLICDRCRRIIDLDLAALDELAEKVAQRTGYQIVHQRLDFFGVCPECQRKA